jgi:diacylglycerol kinase (ATP)
MRRRFFLVVNAGAGVSSQRPAEDVIHRLKRLGASVTLEIPSDFASIRRAVRSAVSSGEYDGIVAAGGDGTIRAAAAGLMGTDVPLGIVPCGTANVLAQEIGLDAAPEAVCHTLCGGPLLAVACAEVNGEPFLLMTGAGFDARVVGALNHALKSRIGKLAYARPLIGALMDPMDSLSVTVDGRLHDASWVVVANARHYGGRFVVAPHTGIEERGLEAILFKAKSKPVLLSQLLSLGSGQLDARAARHCDVEMHKCSHVKVWAHRPVPVQVDGDLYGTTPLEANAGTEVIQLIVPSEIAGRRPRRH